MFAPPRVEHRLLWLISTRRSSMRKSGIMLFGIVTALSAGTGSAETYHAVQCTASGSDVTSFGRNRSGTFNSSETAVKRLHCGAATNGAILSASATVYDRSVTDDVDCTLYVTNPSGTALFTANRQTTGF